MHQFRLCSRSGSPHFIFHEEASVFHTTKLTPNWDCLFYLKQSQEPRGKQISSSVSRMILQNLWLCVFEVFHPAPFIPRFSPSNLDYLWICAFLCVYVCGGAVVVAAVNLQCAENIGSPLWKLQHWK